MTLPFESTERWRWRWMYTPRCGTDGKLHRIVWVIHVAHGGWEDRYEELLPNEFPQPWDEDFVGVIGKTACGLLGEFHMPGILSRMARPRCRHCCRVVGIPPGEGAPFNEGLER